MLIWDSPEAVNQFIAAQGGGYSAPGTFQALGWLRDGKLVAGVVFGDCNGRNIVCGAACVGKSFPIGLYKAWLFYVFGQLKLPRLTMFIDSTNIPSSTFARKMGATLEATLEGAGKYGDTLIFKLTPETSKLWKRLHERTN
jgi:RimJ/RimL family protein N-acetyltransferase